MSVDDRRSRVAFPSLRDYATRVRHTFRTARWLGVYDGHEILLELRGSKIRLSIDGEERDSRSVVVCLTRRGPLLTGRVHASPFQVSLVHIYRLKRFPLVFEAIVGRDRVTMNFVSGS